MQFVGKMISSVSEFYKDINPSTLSGAIDVIVVEDVESGEMACSPFHVRFGKLQLLRPQEKAVELRVNGESLGERLRMKVGEAGETFFVLPKEVALGSDGAAVADEYLTSPLPTASMPLPLEAIEELRLKESALGTGGVASDNEGPAFPVLVSNLPAAAVPLSGSLTVATTTAVTIDPLMLPPSSPEWKWEWGDLPMKKEKDPEAEVERNADVGVNVSASASMALETDTKISGTTVAFTALAITTVEVSGSQPADGLIVNNDDIVKETADPESENASNSTESLEKDDSVARFSSSTDTSPSSASTTTLSNALEILRNMNMESLTVTVHRKGEMVIGLTAEDVAEDPMELLADPDAFEYCFAEGGVEARFPGSIGGTLLLHMAAFKRLPLQVDREGTVSAAAEPVDDDNGKEHEPSSSAGTEAAVAIGGEDESSVASISNATVTALSSSASAAAPIQPSSSWRSWWSRAGRGEAVPGSGIQANASTSSIPLSTTVTTNTASSPRMLNGLETDFAGAAYGGTQNHRASSPTPSTCSALSSGSSSAGLAPYRSPSQQYIKSLRLPSSLLRSLKLRPGVNTISYTVSTRLQGTATCQSRVFLWKSDERIVVSDIDGTITKSDALGHLFTMVGKDWTHVGVASLFTKIAENGYRFLYLTSRAIGQAASTRGYLKGVEQDRHQLPDGPVIMSPDRLFTALHREVIQRRPDEFKIACLRDIQRLFDYKAEASEAGGARGTGSVGGMSFSMFSSDEEEAMLPHEQGAAEHSGEQSGTSSISAAGHGFLLGERRTGSMMSRMPSEGKAIVMSSLPEGEQSSAVSPFYAGFGNRPTDTRSYRAVGIPKARIFVINSAGDLRLDALSFYTPYSASSYSKLTELVDKVFPPLRSPTSLASEAGEEPFTDFQYWRGSGVSMEIVEAAMRSCNRDGERSRRDRRRSISNGHASAGTSTPMLASTSSLGLGSPLVDPMTGKPLTPEQLLTLQLPAQTQMLPAPAGPRIGLAGALDAVAEDQLRGSGESLDRIGSGSGGALTPSPKKIIGSPGSRTNLVRLPQLPQRSASSTSNGEPPIHEYDSDEDDEDDTDNETSMASITSFPYL